MLFVIGTANPNHLANKKLAEELHARLEVSYPGLSRGIILKGSNQGNGVYNQSISEGALLLEFGGTNNTLEECYNTAEAFADVFGRRKQAFHCRLHDSFNVSLGFYCLSSQSTFIGH